MNEYVPFRIVRFDYLVESGTWFGQAKNRRWRPQVLAIVLGGTLKDCMDSLMIAMKAEKEEIDESGA